MRTLIVGLAVVFVLALIAGPAAAESGVATLSGGQESVVATMTLNAGDVVDWAYSSGGSTKFTVDREGTGEVFSTSAIVGTGKFTAPANGQYAFTFKNTGDTLTIVSYDVKRPFNAMPFIAAAGIGAAAIGGTGGLLWYRKKKRQSTGVPGGMPAGMPAEMPPPPPA